MDDIDAIAKVLEQWGVPKVEALLSLATPAVKIRAERTITERLPIGASRFGGVPDLPPGFEWPTRAGRLLEFLAQIDMSEIKDIPELPTHGWLLVFCDYEDIDWGGWSDREPGNRMVYIDATRETLSRVLDHPGADHFEACSLSFSNVVDLPSERDTIFEANGIVLDAEEAEGYEEALMDIVGVSDDSLYRKPLPYHHLFGYPQLIQDDMRRELDDVDSAAESEGEAWRLLLQLDTDVKGPGWMFADIGRLYFWIREDDLAECSFTRVKGIVQCY